MDSIILTRIIAFILGIIPIIIWLVFYLEEDPQPEPTKPIIIVFLLGIIFTVPAAASQLSLNKIIDFFKSFLGNSEILSQNSFIVLASFAFIEELSKFVAADFWVSKTKYFDEETDPLIYLVTAALGFALVENILIFTSESFLNSSGTNVFSLLTSASILRFLGANFLHTLSSGALGFFWAFSILKRNKWYLFWGFIFAVGLHTIFNFAIINIGKEIYNFIILFLIIGLTFISILYKRLELKNY